MTKIIEDDFKHFLDPNFVKFEKINNTFNGGRNFYYKNDVDIFCPTVSNGFEFTHHNIANETQKESILRKVRRFKNSMLKENLIFWYHYRHNENKDINMLISLFEKFDYKFKSAKYVILHQNTLKNDYNFKHTKIGKFNIIECFDDNVWSGADNIFAKTFQVGFYEMFNNYNLVDKL